MRKLLSVNGKSVPVDVEPGAYYVVDVFGASVEGPYPTAAKAEAERRRSNIAGDCIVIQAPLS